MKRYTIVEVCPASHPNAKYFIRENRDLGHQVYKYRGMLILIINDYESIWRAEDAVFKMMEAGIYPLTSLD